MSALYKEITLGASSYATAASISTTPSGYAGSQGFQVPQAGLPLPGFEPQWHEYRLVGGASGGDMFYSYDGVNDHGRLPFIVTEAAGGVNPYQRAVSYRNLWLRSAAGVTAIAGIAFYTRQ